MTMTIIIACKNRHTNLDFCLSSISQGTVVPNTIVVDFGSNPPIQTNHKFVNIIHVNDSSMFHKARALNIGIRKSTSKFVCITDTDQIFQRNFFEQVKTVLTANTSAFVMCKTYTLRSIPANITPDTVQSNYDELLTLAKASGIALHGEGCCNGVSRAWVTSVGGFDEYYKGFGAEDSDLMLRAHWSKMPRIWINDRTTMIHLPHEKCGEYYEKSVFDKNKNYFLSKKKSKKITANDKKQWGHA